MTFWYPFLDRNYEGELQSRKAPHLGEFFYFYFIFILFLFLFFEKKKKKKNSLFVFFNFCLSSVLFLRLAISNRKVDAESELDGGMDATIRLLSKVPECLGLAIEFGILSPY